MAFTIADASGKPLVLNGAVATAIDTPTVSWRDAGQIRPTGTNAVFANNNFGSIIAKHGDHIVVGTPAHPYNATGGNSVTNAGTAWFYHKRDGEWTQIARMIAPPTHRQAGGQYGKTVAVHGDWAFVGAAESSIIDVAAGLNQGGVVHAYKFDGENWVFHQNVFPTSIESHLAFDAFGSSIDFDGKTLVVGSPNHSRGNVGDTIVSGAGATFVFTYNSVNNTWTQRQKIIAGGGSSQARSVNDAFGSAVSVSDNTMVIGAPKFQYGPGGTVTAVVDAGMASLYVYNQNNSTWTFNRYLPQNRVANALVGRTVKVRNTRVLLGSSIGFRSFQFFNNQLVEETTSSSSSPSKVKFLLNPATGRDDVSNVALPNISVNQTDRGAPSTRSTFFTNGYTSMTVPGFNVNNGFTLDFWVNPRAFTPASTLTAATQNVTLNFLAITNHLTITAVRVDNSPHYNLMLTVNGSDVSNSTLSTMLPYEDWTNIVVERLPTSTRVYMNGRGVLTSNHSAASMSAISTIAMGINGVQTTWGQMAIIEGAKFNSVTNFATQTTPYTARRETGEGVVLNMSEDGSFVFVGQPQSEGTNAFINPTTSPWDEMIPASRKGTANGFIGNVSVYSSKGTTLTHTTDLVPKGLVRDPGLLTIGNLAVTDTSVVYSNVSRYSDEFGGGFLHSKGAIMEWNWDRTSLTFENLIQDPTGINGKISGSGFGQRFDIKGNIIIANAPSHSTDYTWYQETYIGTSPQGTYGNRYVRRNYEFRKTYQFTKTGSNWAVTAQRSVQSGSTSATALYDDQSYTETTSRTENCYIIWNDDNTGYWFCPNNPPSISGWTYTGRTQVGSGSGSYVRYNYSRRVVIIYWRAWPSDPSIPANTTDYLANDVIKVFDNNLTLISDSNGSNYNLGSYASINNGALAAFVKSGSSLNVQGNRWLPPGSVSATRTTSQNFGTAVATDGTRIMVGAPGVSRTEFGAAQGANTGQVHVLTYDNVFKAWRPSQYLTKSTPLTGGFFGERLSLRGNRLAVASPSGRGAIGDINVFSRANANSQWTSVYQQTTTPATTRGDDIAVVSDTIYYVGAPRNTTVNSGAGSVELLSFAPNWATTILADWNFANGRQASAGFGTTVSLSNGRIAVGSPNYPLVFNGDGPRATAGLVTVFQEDTENQKWNLRNRINFAANEMLGENLDFIGDNLLVSYRNSTNWVHRRILLDNTSAMVSNNIMPLSSTSPYGGTLLTEDKAVVGIPDLVTNTYNSGGAYVYSTAGAAGVLLYVPMMTNGRWETNNLQYSATSSATFGRNANDRFGYGVSLNTTKNTLVVGAPYHSYNSSGIATAGIGALFTYYWDATTSQYRFQQKLQPNVAQAVRSGFKVMFDGNLLMSSSANVSGNTTAVNYILRMNSEGLLGTWTPGTAAGVSSTVGYGFASILSNNRYIVGRPQSNTPNSTNSGDALITVVNPANATLGAQQVIQATGAPSSRVAGDNFGRSVRITPNYLLVGTPAHAADNDGAPRPTGAGAVFEFVWDASTLRYIPSTKIAGIEAANAAFGYRLSLRGNTLLASAVNGVDMMERENGTWVLKNRFSHSNNPQAVQFGVDQVVIGRTDITAAAADGVPMAALTGAGVAQVFTRDTDASTWSITKNILPMAYDGNDMEVYAQQNNRSLASSFGTGSALSADGQYLFVADPTVTLTANGLSYSGNGTIIVHKFNVLSNRFKEIYRLTNIDTRGSFGFRMEYRDDRLYVWGTGRVMVFLHKADDQWLFESAHANNDYGDTLSTQMSLLDDNTLITGSRGDNGEPNVVNAGTLSVSVRDTATGRWIAPNPHKGADGRMASGGGGGGFRGGYLGGYNMNTGTSASWYGGFGGSNLVPTGGSQIIADINDIAVNTTDEDYVAGIAARGSSGANAGHGRAVISYGANKQAFAYTGEDQEFVVPEGITEITVKLWGAGGGGTLAAGGIPNGTLGGAGGFVTGTLTVTPGEVLRVMVGEAGARNDTYPQTARTESPLYGDGGRGGNHLQNIYYPGANGGGRTEISRDDQALIVAGGGGGASGYYIGGGFSAPAHIVSGGKPGGHAQFSGTGVGPELFSSAAGSISQINGLVNSRNTGDGFGHTVLLTAANRLFVGSPTHNYDSRGVHLSTVTGAVFEYSRSDTKWTIDNKLGSSTLTNRHFGSRLRLTNDGILVGSMMPRTIDQTDIITTTSGVDGYGSAEWIQTANGVTGNRSVISVSGNDRAQFAGVVGNLVVFGDTTTANAGLSLIGRTNAGGFYTFAKSNNTWSLVNRNVTPGFDRGRAGNDRFATSLLMQDDYFVAGTPGHSFTEAGVQATSMGAGFVFARNPLNGKWEYEKKITPSDLTVSARLGAYLHMVDGQLMLLSENNSRAMFSSRAGKTWTEERILSRGATQHPTLAYSQDNFIYGTPTSTQPPGNAVPPLANAGYGVIETRTDGTITTLMDLYAPGRSNGRIAGDQFGYSVYTNGQFVVVGSPGQAFDEAGFARGAVTGALTVFSRPLTTWVHERKLVTNSVLANSTGRYIAGRGNYIIATGAAGNGSSTVVIMERVSNGNWRNANEFTAATLGDSPILTAASDSLFVVGRPSSSGVPERQQVSASGVAETFVRGSTWTQAPTIQLPGVSFSRNSGDAFGATVALSRNFLLVGAPLHSYSNDSETAASQAGAIWLYSREGDNFKFVNRFTSPNRVANHQWGSALDIDERNTYIGVGSQVGNKADIFKFDGTNLTLMNTLTGLTAGDQFGMKLVLSNKRLAISAVNRALDAANASVSGAGAVHTFTLSSDLSRWEAKEVITAFNNVGEYDPNASAADQFTTTTVGARRATDRFGSALALDSKGALVIGTPMGDTNATGGDIKADAGYVVFKRV